MPSWVARCWRVRVCGDSATARGRQDALSEPPPRGSRFGSPLQLSRVHWVRPEMVVEVSFVEWTPNGLLRHVVYLGEREDKPVIDVRQGPTPRGIALILTMREPRRACTCSTSAAGSVALPDIPRLNAVAVSRAST